MQTSSEREMMENSARMVLALALFLAAISAVPSQGRALPKTEQPGAKAVDHPQTFIGTFGGGVYSPGSPPLVGGGTVYGPLVPVFGFGQPNAGGIPGFGNLPAAPGAGGIPGVGNQPVSPGAGGLRGDIGGVGQP